MYEKDIHTQRDTEKQRCIQKLCSPVTAMSCPVFGAVISSETELAVVFCTQNKPFRDFFRQQEDTGTVKRRERQSEQIMARQTTTTKKPWKQPKGEKNKKGRPAKISSTRARQQNDKEGKWDSKQIMTHAKHHTCTKKHASGNDSAKQKATKRRELHLKLITAKDNTHLFNTVTRLVTARQR